jgi:hypothetical protein
MSPELETLDQLLGGDLSLTIVWTLCSGADAFLNGLQGLLSNGDVCLYSIEGPDVPDRQWRELFRDGSVLYRLANLRLKITPQDLETIAQICSAQPSSIHVS